MKVITESGNTDQMRLNELVLKDQEFFRKQMDLFKISEDMDDSDALHMIYKIVKGIILLNSSQNFEKILGDDLLMDIIGSLEYDPEIQSAQHYRDFFNKNVVFKEAIPIRDSVVLSKIHQRQRILYLKDTILPKVLDEATASSLNSIIHSNKAIVVSMLKDDSAFIE
uniref:Serine/threonine-protein phosphatase 4 regulatory subunit 3-like central domain-containing protein n=1 Tax=Kalanchoe fedtschenkoi TaxID=63787 RepID=A0A7N0TDJ9_KALFE